MENNPIIQYLEKKLEPLPIHKSQRAPSPPHNLEGGTQTRTSSYAVIDQYTISNKYQRNIETQ